MDFLRITFTITDIIHAVGPRVAAGLRKEDEKLLESAYKSSLSFVSSHGIRSIVMNFIISNVKIYCLLLLLAGISMHLYWNLQ